MLGRGKPSIRRVDVEGENMKEGWNDEAMCAERLADGVVEPADLVDAEDNMVVMGEVTKCLLLPAAWRPAALIVGKGIQDGGGGGVKARGSVRGTQLPREMVDQTRH